MIPAELMDLIERVKQAVNGIVVGKSETVDLMLTAFLCEGHILLEDVPGVGKTLLARSFAKALGLTFKRVQFTPDLLPSDITGVNVFNQKSGEFEFKPGPVFADILLADEINRATPRTQSSLLEAMEERQVTVDGVTYPLPRHFMVLATQNPVELQGTFPLPEAQLDRFLMRLRLGYPTLDEEKTIVERFERGPANLDAVAGIGPDKVAALKRAPAETFISPDLIEYVSNLTRLTRTHRGIELGASPRATLSLARAAKAYAFIQGRSYVLPDDIKRLAIPVLAHRIIPGQDASFRGRTSEDIIAEVLDSVEVPIGDATSSAQPTAR